MKLKNKITLVISCLIIFLVGLVSYYYKDEFYAFYLKNFYKDEKVVLKHNEYYKARDYKYIKNTNDFVAKDEDHLKDIFYTIINSGVDSFSFECDKEYKACLTDVRKLASNQALLSNINNFVSPFNSFEQLVINYSDKGLVTIGVIKNYSEEEIVSLNDKVDQVISEVITDDMDDRDKIKAIHDYIINNSNYAESDMNNNSYNKATGNLLNGLGLCGGYADSMALFLDRFGINNYKIASETHIWNLVELDNKWYHLDLTWDDPVISDGSHRLDRLFFLITDQRLKELEVDKHEYDPNIYLELKGA